MWLLLGCGASGQEAGREHPNSGPSGFSGLPIESILLLGESSREEVAVAIEREMESCLAMRGYDINLPPEPRPESVFSLKMRYGALPSDDPETWGYRDPVANELARSHDSAYQQLPRDVLVALYGEGPVSESGSSSSEPLPCYPMALQAAYGDAGFGLASLDGYEALVQIQLSSSDRLYAADEAIEAMDAWSSCMSERGFNFANWWEAPATFGVSPDDLSNISLSERTTASADFECRRQTSLETRLLELESKIQEELLEDPANQATIDVYLSAKEALGF